MRRLLNRLGDIFEALPDRLRARKWWVWSVFIIVLVAYAPGAARFHLDMSDEQFFSQDDPVRMSYDRLREQFGTDEAIYIVYRAKDGDIFSEQSLRAARSIQEELLNYRAKLQPGETSPLDYIREVTSINNVSYLEGTDGALISKPFIGNQIPTSKEESNALRKKALAHPDYPKTFVSHNSKYGAIFISTYLGDTETLDNDAQSDFGDVAGLDVAGDVEMVKADTPRKKFAHPPLEVYQEVTHAVYDILNKPEYSKHLKYYPVGGPVINTEAMDKLVPQINVAMIGVIGIIVLMLGVLFRSLSGVVWPLIIIATTAVMVMATLGWFGLSMNMMVNVVILLVLVVGVADSVHILSGYLFFRNQGHNHQESLRFTFRKSGVAIMLTSITTSLGMLALLAMPIVPLKIFGFASAVGVTLAFIFSVTILPLMLDIWHPVSKRQTKKLEETGTRHHVVQKFLRRFEHLSHHKPRRTILIFSLITAFFVVGITQVRVETNFLWLFHPDAPIQEAHRLADEQMGGSISLEIMIDAKKEYAMHDPMMLNAMDGLEQWFLQRFPEIVISTRSLTNIVKSSNQSLNSGRKDAYAIPQNPRVLGQTLFLFNNANPTDRRKVVSDDYSQAHITVTTHNLGTRNYLVILEELDQQIEKRFAALRTEYPKMEVTPTGGMTLFVQVLEFISKSQIKGFSLALLAISLVLFLTFSSKRVGLIALFPNLFPLTIVFGLMGYLDIPLDADTLIVAPLMIGIVVDDTIHILAHYRALVSKHGNINEAIIETFREVGQAITFTSFILAAAFLSFALLDHQGIKHFGLLSSAAIMAALAGDLFLLPALLKATNTRFKKDVAPVTITKPQPEGVDL